MCSRVRDGVLSTPLRDARAPSDRSTPAHWGESKRVLSLNSSRYLGCGHLTYLWFKHPSGGARSQEDGAERAKPSPSRSKSASSSSSSNKKPGGDVINVFTVASGHMYERLQKIMMLSVLNHTKSKVKFWFISNYMSPHHKQVGGHARALERCFVLEGGNGLQGG